MSLSAPFWPLPELNLAPVALPLHVQAFVSARSPLPMTRLWDVVTQSIPLTSHPALLILLEMGGCPLHLRKDPPGFPKNSPPQLLPRGSFLGWSLKTLEVSPWAPNSGRGLTCRFQAPGRGRGRGAEGPALTAPSPRGRAPLGLAGGWGPRSGLPLRAQRPSWSGKETCWRAKRGSRCRAACAPRLAPLLPLPRAVRLLVFHLETTGPTETWNFRRPEPPGLNHLRGEGLASQKGPLLSAPLRERSTGGAYVHLFS